jgi:hypothetical protein
MSDDVPEFPEKLNPLPAEDRLARRKATTARTVTARSPFVKAMIEAQAEYLSMRDQGVSQEDAIKGLEHVLREVWPKHPTKFPVCEDCDGTGWADRQCRQYMRCERERCHEKGDSWQHRYIVPCDCPRGDRFRPHASNPDEGFDHVGKSPKPKSFSRFGR